MIQLTKYEGKKKIETRHSQSVAFKIMYNNSFIQELNSFLENWLWKNNLKTIPHILFATRVIADMCRFTMGIHSENCVGRFCCANVSVTIPKPNSVLSSQFLLG
jgi:hypothetical protein